MVNAPLVNTPEVGDGTDTLIPYNVTDGILHVIKILFTSSPLTSTTDVINASNGTTNGDSTVAYIGTRNTPKYGSTTVILPTRAITRVTTFGDIDDAKNIVTNR